MAIRRNLSNRVPLREPSSSFRAGILIIAGLALGVAGCAEDPWTYPKRETKSVGAEVFRVFCKREAKESFPNDLQGTAFDPSCLGEGTPPESSPRLDAMLSRRQKITDTIDHALGEADVAQPETVQVLEDDELRLFLSDLVPLYDVPDELLPGASRSLAAVLERLIDPQDVTGREALSALSQVAGRRGYRKPELALGLLRSLLAYPELDAFAEHGLKAIAFGGVAEEALDELSLGLALELANYDPAPPVPDSTLRITRDFLLSPIDQTDQPPRAPVSVMKRDARGVAVPFDADTELPAPFRDQDGDSLADVDSSGRFVVGGAPLPAPFPVPGEDPETARDEQGRALNPVNGDAQLYADFDAQPTMAAAFLREDARLSVPQQAGDRTTFEKLGRGLPALFGLPSGQPRTVTYGAATIEFEGPDPASGAFHDVVHAAGAMVRANPEATRRLFEVLRIAMVEHEPEMVQLIDTMLRINERSKAHESAELIGEQGPGTPHRFWDDLLAVGARMTRRDGLIEGLLRMATQPESVAMGPLIAKWMQFNDQARYKNADFTPGNPDDTFTDQQEADLNAQVQVDYQIPVDRGQPDTGANRSVFQQTLSMVHSLRGRGLCNKQGAELHIIRDPNLAFIGELGINLPLHGLGYSECELFEVPDMVRIWLQAILGESKINLQPLDLSALDVTGLVDTGEVQEIETQIHGFNDEPTPESFARFLYGPRNQFAQKLIDPVMKDGASIEALDPYALFAMEVPHPDITLPGSSEGLSFLQAARPMVEAFESHTLVDGEDRLVDGYLFSDLLDGLYMHWGLRSDAPCNGPPEPTCTQHTDPNGRFFSYQTGLASYEPLLTETLRDEQLMASLSEAAKAMASIEVEGQDGLSILAEVVQGLLAPMDGLTYRDGRATAVTNVGDEVGYVSPMYLLLDGLKRIDQNFDSPAYQAYLGPWREARSEIVDLFLTVETAGDTQRLADRIGRSVFIRTLEFLKERIAAHQQAGDLDEWAAGLSNRTVTFFDTPLWAGALHLIEQSWDEPAAGRELMKFMRHIVDEQQNPEGFETTLVAVSDLLQLMEDSPKIAPLFDLASEAIVPGVSKAVDSAGPATFDPRQGILRRLVELQNAIMQEHTRRPTTLSQVAHNLVTNAPGDVQSPLEHLIDAVTEIERVDPSLPSDAVLDVHDLETIAQTAFTFIRDDGHGLERLYDVIQNRTIAGSSTDPTPDEEDPAADEGQTP